MTFDLYVQIKPGDLLELVADEEMYTSAIEGFNWLKKGAIVTVLSKEHNAVLVLHNQQKKTIYTIAKLITNDPTNFHEITFDMKWKVL